MSATSRVGRAIALVSVVLATACPGPRAKTSSDGTTGPTTPGFVRSGAALGEPDPPARGKFGGTYLQLVYARVRLGWRSFIDDTRLRLPSDHALNNTQLAATITIVVDPKGKFVQATVATSSGNADFDGAAVEIARDAGPYPLAERELVGDDGVVRLRWLFARDRRLAGVATASITPARWSVDRAVPKFIAAGDLTRAAKRLAAAVDGSGQPAAGTTAATLAALGRRLAVAAVRAGLRSKSIEVQRSAVGLAYEARAPELAPDLRSLATSVIDHRLRSSAILALGRIGGDDAVALLLSAVRGERGMQGQSGAAAEALVALGKEQAVGPLLLALLDNPGKLSRLEVLQILSRAPVKTSVPRLATIVSAPKTNKAERILACGGLGAAVGRGGDWKLAAKALRRGVSSPDAAVRAACLNGLAAAAASGRKSRVTFWKATELLKRDRDQRVKAAAVRAAVRFEPNRFAKEMYLVRRTTDAGVLAALAESLVLVPGGVAYRRLVRLAKHPDAAVRRAAAMSLAARPEPGSKAIVVAMIGDADVGVRLVVSKLAGADELTALVADPSVLVRFSARTARVRMVGQQQSLAQLCSELAATSDEVVRARVAGAWLAGGVTQRK